MGEVCHMITVIQMNRPGSGWDSDQLLRVLAR
jgi:hypothetical protein